MLLALSQGSQTQLLHRRLRLVAIVADPIEVAVSMPWEEGAGVDCFLEGGFAKGRGWM
jgi:hypothetical protein